jgi:hypothetical protein
MSKVFFANISVPGQYRPNPYDLPADRGRILLRIKNNITFQAKSGIIIK